MVNKVVPCVTPTDNQLPANEARGALNDEIQPTEIKFVEQEKPNVGRPRAPSSPNGAGLTRAVTADAAITSPTEEKSSGGGFLNRMKSLKGGPRKSRPERKDSGS